MTDNSDKLMLRGSLRVLAVPWLMAIVIVLGYFGGAYLDRRIGWDAPILAITLVVIGTVGGAYQSYRVIRRVLRD
jgi:uncharacterized protein YneF (UPF0154 family)